MIPGNVPHCWQQAGDLYGMGFGLPAKRPAVPHLGQDERPAVPQLE